MDCEPGRRIAPLTLEINWPTRELIELWNAVQTALLVVHAAALNPVSRGGHYLSEET